MDIFTGQTDELPYSLHRASFLLQRVTDENLRSKLGLSSAQYKIILGINDSPGLQQKHLASSLGLTEAGISRQVAIAKRKGWVDVRRNREDARKRELFLTPQGKHTLVRADRYLEVFYAELLSRLSHNELDSLSTTLKRLNTVLQA